MRTTGKKRTHPAERKNRKKPCRPLSGPTSDDSLLNAVDEIADEISLAKDVISAMGNAVSLVDTRFRVLYQNELHKKVIGDQTGKLCHREFEGKDAVCDDCPVAMAYADGNVHTIERFVTHKGRGLWIEITASPLRDGQGRIAAGIEIVRDVSVRKRMEESLQEQKLFAEGLIENSAVATFVLDAKHRVILWNKACEQLTGVPSSRIVGTTDQWKPFYRKKRPTLADIIVDAREADLPSLYTVYSSSTLASNGLRAEGWYKEMNGRDRYLVFDAAPIFGRSGELTLVIETLQDITERKHAEEELGVFRTNLQELVNSRTSQLEAALIKADQERAKSEAIIAAVGDGVSIQDADFRVLYQNQIHKDLMGDHAGELCYQAFQRLDRICPDCPVEQSLRDGKVHRAEREVVRADGIHYVEHTASPLKDADGRIVAGVKVIRDVTERKRVEEELIRTEKLESLGVLSGGIAHDFNNLLSALIGNISLARIHTDPNSKVYELLSEAERASSLAKDLTQQLLTYSKGSQPLKKIISLLPLVKGAAEFALRGSNVRFDLSAGNDLWSVEADEGQLSQVVNNLIINAQQAMPKGGTIRICCKNIAAAGNGSPALREGRYVEVRIEDEGIGIPKKYLDKIFDPYFTTKQKGSGLGLATAYSIIKKHEGYLTVDSVPEVGTTFSIFIPASIKKANEIRAESKPLLSGRGKILVMDDEEVIRLIVGRMLESLGYSSESAERGEEAVELYRRALHSGVPIDAVIIDLTIRGGMGGVDCMSALLEIDPNVKAIVSSGYSEDPVMALYDTLGFKGIIVKPYKVEDLGEILHKVLGGKAE